MVLEATDREDVFAPDTGATAGRDKDGKITHVTRLVGKRNAVVKKIALALDRVADSLESKGLVKEAVAIDAVSNALEANA